MELGLGRPSIAPQLSVHLLCDTEQRCSLSDPVFLASNFGARERGKGCYPSVPSSWPERGYGRCSKWSFPPASWCMCGPGAGASDVPLGAVRRADLMLSHGSGV